MVLTVTQVNFVTMKGSEEKTFQEKALSHKCSTLSFARLFAATVYQEPHFYRIENQKPFAFLFDQKNFLCLNPCNA